MRAPSGKSAFFPNRKIHQPTLRRGIFIFSMTMLEKVSRLFSSKKNPGTVVVLSPTGTLKNESKIVCALFEQGLQHYHLRKPRWTAERIQAWIKALPKIYRSRVVLHQFPDLVERLGLGGFHVQAGNPFPNSVPAEKISVQCLQYADFEKVGKRSTIFLGPVFPRKDRDLTTPTRTPQEYAAMLAYWRKQGGTNRVLAFGGTSEDNVKLCKKLGFDGVAVVSAIWESEKTPVAALKSLLRRC